MDPQITIAAARDRVGSHHLHFLCDHSDIDLVTTVVSEAVVAKTVVEPAEQRDIVLEVDVRAAPTTTASPTAESSATAATKTSAATKSAAAESPTASKCRGPVTTAGEPRRAAAISASGRSAIRARRA